MTLPDIIAEVQKLESPQKSIIINKLEVALSILKQTKGAEHLLTAQTIKVELPKTKPFTKIRKRDSEAMPVGG